MKEDVTTITADKETVTAYFKFKRILYLTVKRIFDIFISIIGLIFIIPLTIVIKIASAYHFFSNKKTSTAITRIGI